jgi:hypothetical protein
MVKAKEIKVFNMDNGDEIELLDINPIGVCLNGIDSKVGDTINISIHLPYPIYNNEIIDFSVKKYDENVYVYEEVSVKDTVVLTCLFIMFSQYKCDCQEE